MPLQCLFTGYFVLVCAPVPANPPSPAIMLFIITAAYMAAAALISAYCSSGPLVRITALSSSLAETVYGNSGMLVSRVASLVASATEIVFVQIPPVPTTIDYVAFSVYNLDFSHWHCHSLEWDSSYLPNITFNVAPLWPDCSLSHLTVRELEIYGTSRLLKSEPADLVDLGMLPVIAKAEPDVTPETPAVAIQLILCQLATVAILTVALVSSNAFAARHISDLSNNVSFVTCVRWECH